MVRLLGSGAFAKVYLARHVGLMSLHAVKILDEARGSVPDIRNRFLAEGRIQAQLDHPNVVSVTDIVTEPYPGLVMAYVPGPTLAEWITDLGGNPASTALVLELFLPILDAVGTAHRAGIVHRDLKPENIIIVKDDSGKLRPMVTDFGIAKVIGPGLATGKQKTEVGLRMGTLQYMSPEQVRGAADLDARSDVFALGAILYELLTGRVAFVGESDYDTMQSVVQGRFTPPERVVGGLSPLFAACIRKALATDAAERFQDCAAFAAALRGANDPTAPLPARPSRTVAVTGKPVPVPTPSIPARVPSSPPGRVPVAVRPPGKVVAIGIMHLVSGLLNLLLALFWFFQGFVGGLASFGIGFVLCLPIVILLPVGILEMVSGARHLSSIHDRLAEPRLTAVGQIMCLLGCNLISTISGVLTLVFLGDPQVSAYYASRR